MPKDCHDGTQLQCISLLQYCESLAGRSTLMVVVVEINNATSNAVCPASEMVQSICL